jgi:hypothetical protein
MLTEFCVYAILHEMNVTGNGKWGKKNRITVTGAAVILGVHRVHLSLCIHGHRQSKRLMKRYRTLKREHQKGVLDA